MESSAKARWTILTAVAASVLLVAAGPALAGGRCVTVEVPAPFVMPDGSTHSPGSLKLCDSRRLSPVTGLHRVYVDGHLRSMLESRTGRSEGPADEQPYVQFRVNGNRQYELIGYAWPEGRHMTIFVLATEHRRAASSESDPVLSRNSGVRGGPDRREQDRVILVAASAD